MKEAELRKHADCNACGNKIGASGLPLFWRLRIERFEIDLSAVQRQDGLGAFLGHTALAQVMGPDEDLAQPVMEPVGLILCETCAMKPQLIPALIEIRA